MSVWIYGVPSIFTDSGLVRAAIDFALPGGVSEATKVYNVYFNSIQTALLWLAPDVSTRYVTQYPHFFFFAVLMVAVWIVVKFLLGPFRLLALNLCPKCKCCCGAGVEGLPPFSEAIKNGKLKGHHGYR